MEIFIYLFVAAAILSLLRAAKGPSFADRYLGINNIVCIAILLMVLQSFELAQQFYLDMAILLAILSFVGSLAIAKYAPRGNGE